MYKIFSTDRTQTVYRDLATGDLLAMDIGLKNSHGKEQYETDSRDEAYEVWQSLGGEYGEFEVVNGQ